MKVVVQRSKKSKVTINNKVNGSIDKGYVLLVGFTHSDTTDIVIGDGSYYRYVKVVLPANG